MRQRRPVKGKSPRSRKRSGQIVHRKSRGKGLVTFIKLGVACFLLWGMVGAGYYLLSLRYDLSEIADMPQRSVVFDRSDQFYSRFSGENRVVVPFDRVSNDFFNALIAREDTRFYQHLGVDPVGIVRAALRNLLMGGIRQGGSTITQQLARNSFPLGGRNYHRKLLEAALSFRIETELSKEEILECYVNRIYFGSGCYGIETAAKTYFNKPASRLTLAESALLAGLIKSPSRLSPMNDSGGAVSQRNVVLGRMLELGFITAAEQQAALREPLKLNPQPPSSAPQENWAMDAIRKELEVVLPRTGLDTGELSIFTTIDPELQQVTERAVSERIKLIESQTGYPHKPGRGTAADGSDGDLEGAAIFLDHRDGAIRSIAGGRNYAQSKFNRALLGRRPAGSTVKPFVYAHAFARGLSPNDRIDDGRLQPSEIPKKYGPYNPENSDREYGGMLPSKDGLIFSRNTMTVRVGLWAGMEGLVEILQRAGLVESPDEFPALCLGSFETNLHDMVSAITAFPNRGNQVHPFVIRKVTDGGGRVLFQAHQVRTPLLEPEVAGKVADVMEEVMRRGTGSSVRALGFRGRVGGKTGTTNAFQDAWFVGFSGYLTGGVWVGFDYPKTIMPGGGGAQLALPVWVDVMTSRAASRYR